MQLCILFDFHQVKVQNILNNQENLKEITDDTETGEDINKLIISAKNEKKEIISYTKKNIEEDKFIKVYNKIKKILSMVVTANVIERLRENNDVTNWVSQGLELNKKYKNEVCEFCGNVISKERIEELEAHFNDEVSKTKQELENLLKELEIYNIKENEIIIDKSSFYKENSTEIELLNKHIVEELLKLDELIKNIKQNIEEKKNNPFKKIELNEIEKAKEIIKNYNSCITIQERYVKETNDKSINFEKKTKEIKAKLAKYY